MKCFAGSLLTLFILLSVNIFAQNTATEISKWQTELNLEYTDKLKSPLSAKDRAAFKGHSFFKIDTSYNVKATVVLSKKTEEIPFTTSTNRVAMHKEYATLKFSIKGKQYSLMAYQSLDLMKVKEYEDYLFLPFTDETSGLETYGGGRYIDLKIPTTGNTIMVDFNKSYNPYCAYSKNFSCPKVPAENNLAIKISAGVKYEAAH